MFRNFFVFSRKKHRNSRMLTFGRRALHMPGLQRSSPSITHPKTLLKLPKPKAKHIGKIASCITSPGMPVTGLRQILRDSEIAMCDNGDNLCFSDFEHINGAVTRKTLYLEVTKDSRHFESIYCICQVDFHPCLHCPHCFSGYTLKSVFARILPISHIPTPVREQVREARTHLEIRSIMR